MKPEYKWTSKQSVRFQIMETICKELNCTIDDLRGKCKTTHVFNSRVMYSYITRKHLGDTLERISDNLNLNHHSSVINHLERLEDFRFTKDPLIKTLEKIEQELLTKQII